MCESTNTDSPQPYQCNATLLSLRIDPLWLLKDRDDRALLSDSSFPCTSTLGGYRRMRSRRGEHFGSPTTDTSTCGPPAFPSFGIARAESLRLGADSALSAAILS